VTEAQHQPTGVDEVDLMRDRGLQVEIGVRGYGAQGKSRATERATVVEHPVDAGSEATPGTRGDVKGTAEYQIATNVDQVVERTADHIRFSEVVLERGTAVDRESAVLGEHTGHS